MQKKFVSTLLLLLLLNLLVKPLWVFGIDLPVQNRVGAEEYGLYFALFNFSLFFNILLDFGLTHYNNQEVSRNSRSVKSNFSHLTSLKLMLGIFYFLVTLVLGLLFNYSGTAIILLSILSFNQFLASLLLFLRSNLAGLQLFRADSFLSIIDKSLMIIFCGSLLFFLVDEDAFSVFHFAWAQTASYAVSVVIAFTLVWKKVKIFKWRVRLDSYKKGLRKSFPYALLILLMSLYTRVDGVMLDRMIGSYENGIYAASFRLLDTLNQMGYLFAVLLLPMFAKMLAGREKVSDLTRLSFGLIMVATLGVVLSTGLQAEEVMEYLYRVQDPSLPIVFRLLIFSSLAFATTFIFGTLLTAANKLRVLNTIALSGFLLNIILNFLLIPVYKAEGAAVATLITQSLTALAQLYFSFRLLRLEIRPAYFGRMAGFAIIGLLLSWSIVNIPSWHFLVNTVLILIVTAASAFLFRLFNISKAINLLKEGFKSS